MSIEVKKRYGIIGVVGDREDGKTTWVARHMKREMAMKTNYKYGFANLHYNSSPEITFTNYAGIRSLDLGNREGIPTAIVHIDQIHKYCPARRAGSKENVEFCETLIECRQHGFDPVVTTWAMSWMDPLLRKFVKLWVSCSKRQDGFHYDYFDVDANAFITPPGGLVLNYQAAETFWRFFNTGELVDDNTLTKVSHVPKDQRDAIAKKLAIYQPCGEKPLAKTA